MTVEKKPKWIIKDDNPKKFKFNDQEVYLSKKILNDLKKQISNKEEYENKKGGVFPLLAALPAILAGLGGAAGIAGGVAPTVNNAKQAKKTNEERSKLALKTEKFKEELKQLKSKPTQSTSGAGVYLSPYEGRAFYDFIKNTSFKRLPFLKSGDGVCLSPNKL